MFMVTGRARHALPRARRWAGPTPCPRGVLKPYRWKIAVSAMCRQDPLTGSPHPLRCMVALLMGWCAVGGHRRILYAAQVSGNSRWMVGVPVPDGWRVGWSRRAGRPLRPSKPHSATVLPLSKGRWNKSPSTIEECSELADAKPRATTHRS